MRRPNLPPTAPTESADLPVFWTVSISRLSELLRDVTLEYDGLAHIESIRHGFDDAVRHIRQRLANERCDAVIAAGSNGAYLRSRLPLPVITVKASGFDVMQALARARRIAPQVGLISYQDSMPALQEFAAAFDHPILVRKYDTEEDARAQVNDLVAHGVKVVVGAGLVTDLAEEAGLQAVFMYSDSSVRQAFDTALELVRHRSGKPGRSDTLRARYGLHDLRGESPAMEQLRQTVLLYAKSPATVLIQGETGTGKEMIAQAIHYQSERAPGGVQRPFVAINCGALTESLLEAELFGYEDGAFTGARRGGHAGLFEVAKQGTLLLDEIGEMPQNLQTRLLRVLEEREIVRVGGTRPVPVQVRIISATHCDLEQRVFDGRFRADLFYRLAVLRIGVPALRERIEDVLPLAEWCLRNALATLGGHFPSGRRAPNLPAELATCAALLTGYHWPGNVRQLRNIMERLALHLAASPLQALTPTLLHLAAPELLRPAGTTNQFGPAWPNPAMAAPAASGAPAGRALATPAPAPDALDVDTLSAAALEQLLARFGQQKNRVAQHLGISRTTLWRRLRQLQAKA